MLLKFVTAYEGHFVALKCYADSCLEEKAGTFRDTNNFFKKFTGLALNSITLIHYSGQRLKIFCYGEESWETLSVFFVEHKREKGIRKSYNSYYNTSLVNILPKLVLEQRNDISDWFSARRRSKWRNWNMWYSCRRWTRWKFNINHCAEIFRSCN